MSRRAPLLLIPLLAVACNNDVSDGLVRAEPGMKIDIDAIDFGDVQIGTTAERTIEVLNDGEGPLRFDSVTQGMNGNPDFTFGCRQADGDCESVVIPPSGTGVIIVSYSPKELGPDQGQVTITPNTTEVPPKNISLSGVGSTAELRVTPTTVDFGQVVVDTTKSILVTVENVSTIDADVHYTPGAEIEFCGATASTTRFCIAPTSRPFSIDSRFTLGPGETTELSIEYAPSRAQGRDNGTFSLRGCADCTEIPVELSGMGVQTGFQCSPLALDFGAVNPEACITRTVTCENSANEVVTVVDWGPSDTTATSDDFVIPPFAGLTALAQGDTMTIDVEYCPDALGQDTGALQIETDNTDELRRFVRIPLEGNGGGPDIDVTPLVVDFGIVSLLAPSRRVINIGNLGFAELEISQFRVDTATTGVFSAPMAGRFLPVGGFTQLFVEFRPTEAREYRSGLIVFSDDQDEPQIAVELRGTGIDVAGCDYSINPPTLNFGVVERGRTAARAFEVRNEGQGDCILTNATLLGRSDDEFSLSDETRSVRIAPGGAGTVRVEYAPTELATHAGTVEIQVSSDTRPTDEVNVTGTGADGALLIVPREIDFGTVPLQCRAREREIIIYNTSPTTAILNRIEIEGGGHVAFSLGNVPQLPLVLAPGVSTSFNVQFATSAAVSSFASAVQIDADFLGQPVTYFVSLQGRGDNSAVQVDQFNQLGQPKVDMLMVIDNSQSMSQEQASLGANFEAFIDFADREGLDYNIAVTTTDVPGDGGQFVGDATARIVRPQTQPTPSQVFSNNINVGVSGNQREQGLQAAFLALSNPLIFGHNSGFLRTDAVLSLIFVSDEDDQSPQNEDFYTNFFLSIKGFRNTNLFSASAIVGDLPSGCSGVGGTAQPARRYADVARRTGGIFQSICTNDWNRALAELSTTAFGFKSRFFLSNQPVLSTLRVQVDGADVPEISADQTRNWEYQTNTNSLNFTPFSTPEPGAVIRVEYEVQCL